LSFFANLNLVPRIGLEPIRSEDQRILSPKGFSLNAPQNQVEICTKTVYSVGSRLIFPTVFPTPNPPPQVDI
jgi:hypothetical protein